jgi:hypothetical protein
MLTSRFQTGAEFKPGIRLVKTVAGLVVILVIISIYLIFLLSGSAEDIDDRTISQEPAGVYLSAVYGKISANSGDGEEIVRSGASLVTGSLYKLEPSNSSLLRFLRDDFEILVNGAAFFTVGTKLDPSRFSMPEGNAFITCRVEPGAPIPLTLGQLRVEPKSMCSFEYRHGKEPVLSALNGELFVETPEFSQVIAAGTRLIFTEDGVEIEEFTILPPPQVLSPTSGTLYRKSSEAALALDFVWEEQPEISAYRFQLSRNILFNSTVFERTVNQTSISLADLAEGMYYWRVIGQNNSTNAVGIPSKEIPFSVELMRDSAEEAVSAPDLVLNEVSTQSNLISIRGKTEPGARIRIRMESFGQVVIEPFEILVQSTGDFVTLVEAPLAGEFDIFVEAFYRPEFVTTEKTTVDVDF